MVNDEIEHTFQDLNNLYSELAITYHDLTNMGFAEAAEVLASQILDSLVASSYLDIGCGRPHYLLLY